MPQYLSAKLMQLTVAICTWNRAALLHQTLQRMCTLRVPAEVQWELLVVNNNCTDDTDQVIELHSGKLPIRRLFEPAPGQSNARNCALTHAQGDWVLWTDDDVLVDSDWLIEFVNTTRLFPDAAAIGGLVEPWFPVAPDPILMEAFPCLRDGFAGMNYGPEQRVLRAAERIYGANMAYRSDAVRGLSFDPRLGRVHAFQGGNDDVVFHRAVIERGGQVIWSPRMRLQHYVDPARMTVAYLRRLYRDGAASLIRFEGVPNGPRLFGVPRWLVRKYLEATFCSWYYGITWRRISRLRWEQQRWSYGGMLSACWAADQSAETLERQTAGPPASEGGVSAAL